MPCYDSSMPRRYVPAYFPNKDDALAFVNGYDYWYQRIFLGHDVYTRPIGPALHERVWDRLKACFPADLHGASALDVGTNAGFFPIQLKNLGAGKIVGLEFEDRYLSQSSKIKEIYRLDDFEILNMDAHRLVELGSEFDITVFTGIFYHLKNPLQVIEDIGRLTRDAILIEGEVIPESILNGVRVRMGFPPKLMYQRSGLMKFVGGGRLNNDGSNWWVMDRECLEQMLRVAGFRFFSRPVYLSQARLVMVATKNKASILDIEKLR